MFRLHINGPGPRRRRPSTREKKLQSVLANRSTNLISSPRRDLEWGDRFSPARTADPDMGAHAVRAHGLLELLWQLVEANQALQRFCFLDGLTGIANRRRFEECLDLEWRRALRDATCLSVIMVDIDDFKIYNDTHGHRKGDQCLQRVAGALSGALRRPGDLLARYGGEEFVVLLCPGTHARGAAGVGKALRTRVEDLGIPRAHSRVSDRVTVSGGVATMVPRPGSSPAALVAAADQVLYQAKRAGRNRVRISPLAERGSR